MNDKSKILSCAEQLGYSEIKLNLGSGGRPLPGWINIDNYDYEKNDSSRSASIYDLKADIRDLDVPDNYVDAILLVHVLEHFVRWETVGLLRSWFGKLKTGGCLIVEMPDLDKCIEWYLRGKNAPTMRTPIGDLNMGFTQFYGNQWDRLDYETHRYVWTQSEFCAELSSVGFKIISAGYDAKFHQPGRDMFVVAQK